MTALKKYLPVLAALLLIALYVLFFSSPQYDKYTAYNTGNENGYPNEVKKWGPARDTSKSRKAAKLETENVTGKKLVYQETVLTKLSDRAYYIFTEDNSSNLYKIDAETGSLVGAYFADVYSAANKAETVPDYVDYETNARDFISKYIDCSKYTVTVNKATDSKYYSVLFRKYISGSLTSEYASVHVHNNGDVISFELSMIGKFDSITELTWNQEKCEAAVQSKIAEIYGDKLVDYSISKQTIVLYDENTPAILFEVSVDFLLGESTVGELRSLLIFI
jgi:hypothetical protein